MQHCSRRTANSRYSAPSLVLPSDTQVIHKFNKQKLDMAEDFLLQVNARLHFGTAAATLKDIRLS